MNEPTPIQPNRANRRSPKAPMADRLAAAERQRDMLSQFNDALIDAVNAIILRDGGQIVVAAEYWQSAQRRPIHLVPSPDRSYITITAEGIIPTRPKPLVERLKSLGLVGG